jgi:hypothetical protein
MSPWETFQYGLVCGAIFTIFKAIAMILPPILPKPPPSAELSRIVEERVTQEIASAVELLMNNYVPSRVYQNATSSLLKEINDLRAQVASQGASLANLLDEKESRKDEPLKRAIEL